MTGRPVPSRPQRREAKEDRWRTMTTGHGHDERNEDHGAATSYVVPNSWEHARRRLELLETCYDAASFRRAAALGVREGWRCLEAGAGHGSYARWLGSQVGAAGSVIAADLDTRLLAGITEPNIEVRQLDLVLRPAAGRAVRLHPHPHGADAPPGP